MRQNCRHHLRFLCGVSVLGWFKDAHIDCDLCGLGSGAKQGAALAHATSGKQTKSRFGFVFGVTGSKNAPSYPFSIPFFRAHLKLCSNIENM